MTELLMIVPSRARPHNIAALLDAWAETTTGDTELWIALDEDDPSLDESRAVRSTKDWGTLRPPHWVVGPRRWLAGTLNAVSAQAVATGRYRAIGFIGDDHHPRTLGWDEHFTAALRELGSGFVYGNDLLQGERLPTGVAMTAYIIATLGYMAPSGLVHLYLDNCWLALGKRLDRIRYLPDVVLEHMHFLNKKAPDDDLYREVNSLERNRDDKLAFERWMADGFEADVQRLLKVL
ncbi:hypothetical protein ABZ345_22755 [Lentzea sp. NPDC005914]|uniref:hypothetical protein n=1 Tax=Lentzea sp. NPDC005914 TaxID=3154572 RepID=UPI0033E7DDBA